MKKLNELASKLKVSNSAVNAWCRAGKFKTAGKIRDNHIDTWFIDNEEFDEFVYNYGLNKITKKFNKLGIIMDNVAGIPDKVMLNDGNIWLVKKYDKIERLK